MLDDIAKRMVPAGALLALGLAVGTLFSKELRPVAKMAIRTGLGGMERVQELGSEALERVQDLVAEVQDERERAVEAHGGAAASGES